MDRKGNRIGAARNWKGYWKGNGKGAAGNWRRYWKGNRIGAARKDSVQLPDFKLEFYNIRMLLGANVDLCEPYFKEVNP